MEDNTTVSENKSQGDEQGVNNNKSGKTFEEQFSEQGMPTLQRGMIIKGKVVQITPEVILCDIGWKTEGYIPRGEMLGDTGGAIEINIGDVFDMFVEGRDPDGIFILSRKQIIKNMAWERIAKAHENEELITGVIKERVKGGFMVDLNGIPAFLPGSQTVSTLLTDFNSVKGNAYQFEIIKYERKRGNVVVSQKTALKKEEQKLRKATLAKIQEGDVIEGIVKNTIDYGVFVDIGGVDGLLHMNDIAWCKVARPSDYYKRGDKISVKVLSLDREKGKVYLGVKQLSEDPWDNVAKEYKVGDIVKGKVLNVLDYGFFVELSLGIIGLVHRSEISWGKAPRSPQKEINIGEEISAMIIGIDYVGKKVSLSVKRVKPNPWETVKERYQEGTIVTGPIKSMTAFGVFVGLEDGVDGLLHISEVSWHRHIDHPIDVFKRGDMVTAVVLNVDIEAERISLGMKQLEDDPWTAFSKKYPTGTPITGHITNITDFGAFIYIEEEGMEGLLHVSDFDEAQAKEIAIGNEIKVIVKNVDKKNKKIRFAMKFGSDGTKETTAKPQEQPREEIVITTAMGEAFANAFQQDRGNR